MTRRGFIKWTTALVAGGAAVVGIGVGYGSDLLLRPTTEKTITQTQTQTVTAPAPTLSYVPPLSPSVQDKVNSIVQSRIALHQGDTVVYAGISTSTMGGVDLSKVHIKNGVVVGVEPDDSIDAKDPREASADLAKALIRGTPAQQQYSFPAWINDPTRVLYPMKRVGARGDPNGAFTRISWDEALTTVANEILHVKSTYGPNSIHLGLVFFGMIFGFTLPTYVGVGTGGWGNVSFGAQQFAETFVAGGAGSAGGFPGAEGQSAADLFNSKLIVLWGQDPSTAVGGWGTNAYTWYYRLAKEKGIPIIVIDARYSMAAEALASQWIPIRPSTDIAMLLAVANVLFKENLYDSNYVSKFVEPTGFAKWKDYVLGNTAGPDGAIDRTPAWAETICGVPADTITAFARLYAKSKPVWLNLGMGPCRQQYGTEQARAAMYLQIMTGNLGISGGNASFCSYSAFTGIPAPSPNYGAKPASYQANALYMGYKWADAVLLREQYDNGTITKQQYFAAIGNNINNPAPNLKMIVFTSGTGTNQTVNINKSIAAIKKLEMAVALMWHWGPPAKLSDIVLPVAEYFEYNMGFMPTEQGNIGFIYVPKLVSAQGESKDPDWINVQIAKKLGVADQYAPALANVPDDQWDSTKAQLMQQAYTTWAASDAAKTALGTTPPAWSDFVSKPFVRAPNVIAVPFADQISSGKKFATASGKLEFYSSVLQDAWSNWDQSKVNVMLQVGGPIPPMAEYRVPEESILDPKVKTYPLMLVGAHNRYHGHSFQSQNPYLRGDLYEHAVWINPADAKARGIQDGDSVRIYNDTGQVVVPAYVTSRMVPGEVQLHDGTWYQPTSSGVDMSGCESTITRDSFNPHGEDTVHSLCEVEKF